MSKDILKSIINKDVIDNIKFIEIKRQFLSIDILLILTLNNNKKYYVIIEDKIDGSISDNQKYFYINKLDPSNGNKEKLKEIGITDFIPQKLSIVLLKTGIKNNNINYDEVEYNNYKFILKKITSLELYTILEKYKDISEIINTYYKYLEFKLKINNKLKGETADSIRKKGYITIDETIFSKNYYCYNCFIHLISKDKKEYTAKKHTQTGGINLKELTNSLKETFEKSSNKEHKKIYVDAIRFDDCTDITNILNEDKSEWTEIYSETNKKKTKKNRIRYIFLFGKTRDSFGKINYVFYGLYKYKETIIENKTTKNIWIRCELNDKNIPLNKNKLIELIQEIEEKEILI